MKKLLSILGLAVVAFAHAGAFDEGVYYYLSTEFEGDNRVLDIVNDGQNNDQPCLADKANISGQLWRITPAGDGYYRLTTQWRGQSYALDIVNDGENNNQPVLAEKADVSGQLWSIAPTGDGYFRLTTMWRGENYSLDVYNDADRGSKSVILARTGHWSGQYWKLTKSSVETK